MLKKKPFVPAKSSKKPTTARAPKLGVVRAATPAASNGGAGAGTSSGAAPASAQQAATKIPVRKHVAPKRRRPTPHPFAQATKSRLPTPHRDRATAAQAKAGGKGYNAYRGKVAYSGDSLFSPKKVAQPRKKFDLKASLAKGLSYVGCWALRVGRVWCLCLGLGCTAPMLMARCAGTSPTPASWIPSRRTLRQLPTALLKRQRTRYCARGVQWVGHSAAS